MFLTRHTVFVRRAREACEESLFFLYLLEETGHPETDTILRGYAPFALRQIRALINGVHLQEAYWRWRPEGPREEQALNLFRLWQGTLREYLNGLDGMSLEEAGELRTRMHSFLEASRQRSDLVPRASLLLLRNLSGLLALLFVLMALGVVPAVRSLVFNGGMGGALWPGVGFLAVLGAVVLWHRAPRRRVGMRAFWSLRFPAREPEKGLVRWPQGSLLMPDCIALPTLLKGLLALLALGFWAGFLWLCSRHIQAAGVDATSLTVFTIFSLAGVLVALAHLLDVWDFFDPARVRRWGLSAAAVVLLAYLLSEWGPWALLGVCLGAGFLSARRLRSSRREVPSGAVLLLSFLLGLGVLAAGFRGGGAWREDEKSTGWSRIDSGEWPFSAGPGPVRPVVLLAASGGGSRAAVYTALTLRQLEIDFPEVAAELQAMSAVSGGSLAAAAYIARRIKSEDLDGLVQAVSQDFLLPTLIGALVPWESRGRQIEHTWEEEPVGLGGITLADLSLRWKEALALNESSPPFPLPLFNTSTLDSHDVVLSPLAGELYGAARADYSSQGNNRLYQQALPYLGRGETLTWVFHRDAIYALESLLPSYNPTLAQAVRASANFPFGFPLVRVVTGQPLFLSPRQARLQERGHSEVHLTDGGVLSNSGLWPLGRLILAKRKVLRRRGLLLIVVEASRMPSYRADRRSIRSLYSAISDRAPEGQNLHRALYRTLRSSFGYRLQIVQIDLIPTERYNVGTTWALDRGSLQRLKHSFRIRWERVKSSLGEKWESIQRVEPPAHPFPAIQRPPLN